ncbi:hypothetical protein [Halopiger goleimassiliensis]|uniref:hypothetical protein n=1 Tax=Halopiger goleimassiliensis TaxID=1293048 RepID=UPI000677FD40|nr:hypothetical protein [Halopiger goleimassiliensis]
MDIQEPLASRTRPVATPFDDVNDVDEGVLAALLETPLPGGTPASIPCGTAGEFPSRPRDERRRGREVTDDGRDAIETAVERVLQA